MTLKCTTCGTDVLAKDNFVKFNCPNCGKTVIVRCNSCKAASSKYICQECNFTGP